MFFDPSEWDGKLYSSGWVAGGAGSKPIFEPATQGSIGAFGVASAEDVSRAAATAAVAQKSWAASSYEVRSGVLRRAGALIEEHADVLGDWLIREAGSAKGKAGFEAHLVAGVLLRGRRDRHGAVRPAAAQRQAAPEPRPAGPGRHGRRHLAVQLPADPLQPLGRAGAGARQRGHPEAGPAHRHLRRPGAGRASCARPACPTACFHVLPGGAEVGSALVVEPSVRVISFTGSTGPAARSASSGRSTSSGCTSSSAATTR